LPSDRASSFNEKDGGMDLLVVIGVVMIVEGVPWFLSPGGYKRLLLQVLPLNDGLLRLMGLVLMLAGLLLVYLVKGWLAS
jgi:uncharacterized protein YjeT (DUF2065 family)